MAYARVSTYEIPTERIDEAGPAFEEATRQLQGMEGIKEAMYLIDRTGGKALTLTIWDSHEAMLASEKMAKEVRERGASSGGGAVKTVDRYEIALRETF